MSYISTVILSLAAWFAGLLIDANVGFDPVGFLSLRVILPMIVLTLCVMKTINGKKGD